MKNIKKTFWLYLLVTICYFTNYFIKGDSMNLVLGFAWAFIMFSLGIKRNKETK